MTGQTDIVIDTDILIDAGRRVQLAIDYLHVQEQQYSLTISERLNGRVLGAFGSHQPVSETIAERSLCAKL